jgi:hypothetical protein
LSRSLRHYAEDGRRPERRDPSLVTGWNEAGYLRDEGGGLGGEIRFATASGTVVSVKAESCPERGTQVTVRAVGNGVEHEFSLDDFSECRRDRRAGPARVTAYALAPGKGPGM